MSLTPLEEQIGLRLRRWVAAVDRRASGICWGIVAVTLLLATHAALELGINSDNMSLISDRLPSHEANAEFKSLFLTLDSALLVVIDAETPELARRAGEEMEEARQERERKEEARQKRDWQTRAAAVGVSLSGSFPFATAELEVQLSLPPHCATA